MTPRITAICASYNRPRLLGNAIAMFLEQDLKDSVILIFDDSGIYGDTIIENERWTLFSSTKRFPCVGAKRNWLIDKSPCDAVACWDDDDGYLPWHLSAAYAALQERCWAQPTQALEWSPNGKVLTRHWVDGEDERKRFLGGQPRNARDASCRCYGSQWSWSREAIKQCGCYPTGHGNGEDTRLCERMFDKFRQSADPLKHDSRPSMIYSRHMSGTIHGSMCGEGLAYMARFAAMPRESADDFKIELPSWYHWAIENIPSDVLPRKW